jgi:hypothetical protein
MQTRREVVCAFVAAVALGCARNPKVPDRCVQWKMGTVATGTLSGAARGGAAGAVVGVILSPLIGLDRERTLEERVLDEKGNCRYGEDGGGKCLCENEISYPENYLDQISQPPAK